MSLSDAELMQDNANYAVTRYEQGAHPENLAEERTYDCGCKAVRVHTIAGWQWVDDPGCDDDKHRKRGR